jgi:hypothetical protein
MPLFLADHRHTPASCPLAAGVQSELFEHITAANASRHGVTILAEAVPTGEHRLLFVLHAASQDRVERFLNILTRYGTLEILPAQSTEAAVAHGGCTASRVVAQS